MHVLAVILSLLIALQLILPSIVLSRMNRALDSLEHYKGHIQDFNMSILSGVYQIQGLVLRSRQFPSETLLNVNEIRFRLDWKDLLRGRLTLRMTEAEEFKRQLSVLLEQKEFRENFKIAI